MGILSNWKKGKALTPMNPVATTQTEGIHSMLSRDKMSEVAKKRRDFYAIKPNQPFIKQEFGFYCIEEWKKQGMPGDHPNEVFSYDPPGKFDLMELGWCEAAFEPMFDVKILEDRGELELVQDNAGRSVLYFKGRRDGFMPEYVAHPVKDMKSWEENVKWRLDPKTSTRIENSQKKISPAISAAKQGEMITQRISGGYMYLRSLIGPVDLMYMLYDNPEVVHDCMKTWVELADHIISYHQEFITIDELYIAEDICYNGGPLISPDMIREFLFPYYQQLISNLKSRQMDKTRHLYFHLDTDGDAPTVFELYKEIGMDVTSPLEVASGCDVVSIGKEYPDLVLSGGFDKRILARTKDDIDREIDRIFPVMYERGGYLPTCDHGVPAEVPYENYVHYRKRCAEFSGAP